MGKDPVFVDPSGARPRWTRRAFAVLTIPLGGFLVVTAAGFHDAGLAGGTWGLPDLPILSSEDETGPGAGSSGVGSEDEDEDADADDGPLVTDAVTVAMPFATGIEPDLPAFLTPVDVPGAGDEASLADADADVGGDEATGQAPAPSPSLQKTPPASAPVPPGSSPSGSTSAAPTPGPTTDPTTPTTSEPAPEPPADPDPDPAGSDEAGDADTGEGGA